MQREDEAGMNRNVVSVPTTLGVVASALLFALAFGPAESLVAQDPTEAIDAPRMSHVVVIIRRLRNDHGQVLGGLYVSSDVWLQENRAAADCHAPVHDGEARCVFDVPASLRVAFAGMHDENGNHRMDRDLVGLPQEGYMFSNNVRGDFGPPSFAAASFEPLPQPRIVRARYGL